MSKRLLRIDNSTGSKIEKLKLEGIAVIDDLNGVGKRTVQGADLREFRNGRPYVSIKEPVTEDVLVIFKHLLNVEVCKLADYDIKVLFKGNFREIVLFETLGHITRHQDTLALRLHNKGVGRVTEVLDVLGGNGTYLKDAVIVHNTLGKYNGMQSLGVKGKVTCAIVVCDKSIP